MANLNKCTFIGTLGRDVELKYMPSGDAACTISIAINSKWKDKKTGEDKESTEWVPLEFFGKLAEIAGKYLKKGSQIYVEGRYSTRKYEKDGVEKYITSVKVDQMQMLSSKPADSGAEPAPAQRAASSQSRPSQNFSDNDSDIPF
jgi:single-strand DNA-binding protein